MKKLTIGTPEFKTYVETIITKSNLWQKGPHNRLYIYDSRKVLIYKTRKCEQKVYIDLNTFAVHCETICNAQPDSWCSAESNRVIDALQSTARLLRMVVTKKEVEVATTVSASNIEEVCADIIMDATEVYGYVTEWRSVRVAINKYGKLATRNRQFMVLGQFKKSTAPFGFVEIDKEVYDYLKANHYTFSKSGELMLEPYAPVPNVYQWYADHLDRVKMMEM
jgi:hypothetical protein